MIDPVTQFNPGATFGLPSAADGMQPAGLRISDAPGKIGLPGENDNRTEKTSFIDLMGDLVHEVDAKGKASEAETRRLMLGESNSIHGSVIAMQEAGLAFSLLVEVRNKVVESYQELMRMPV
jgi:flagellar hook-basal body complex protein FliE